MAPVTLGAEIGTLPSRTTAIRMGAAARERPRARQGRRQVRRSDSRSRTARAATGVVAGVGVAALTMATLGVPAQADSEAAPGAGAPGIGDSYWPQDGNGGIDVQHYKIDTRYTPGSTKLAGATTLRLKATENVTAFNLDFLLPVKKVMVDGKKVGFLKRNKHELQIKQRLRDGRSYKVRVSYAGQPGKYGYAGEKNWLADKHEAVAMNEPHMAPWWFPSNDHPQDKATFAINVTVPKGQQGIANGNLLGKKAAGDKVTWRWRADEPMTTYLAFFAAGKFDIKQSKVGDKTMINAVSQQVSNRKGAMRWLERSDEVVAALEKDLGPYPFNSMGGLVTNLPVSFALENQTRPTYPGAGGIDLLVHELAHQWVGDSVAVHRWRDIWLNEGFASFFEHRYAEQHGGPSADEWMRDEYASSGAEMFRLNIANPGAGRVFDWQVYQRGGMALQALRNRVGEDDFWAIMRGWTEKYADSNATVRQFEKHAAAVSGEDLDSFFHAWLRSGKKPADTAEFGLG